MSKIMSKTISSLNKVKGFLSIFVRNVRGMIGLILILLFAVMALGAPLLTPYQPTGAAGQWLSGSFSAPLVLKYLPKALGGMPGAAENFAVLNNSDFSNGLSDWSYTLSSWNQTEAHPISFSYAPDEGVNFSKVNSAILPGGEGSAKVTYERNETSARYGEISVSFYKKFYFPFGASPRKFIANLDMLPGGSTSSVRTMKVPIKLENTTIISYNMTVGLLDVKVMMYMYLKRLSDGKIFVIWPYADYSGRGMKYTSIYNDPVRNIPGKGTLNWDNMDMNTTWPPPDTPWILSTMSICDSDMIRYSTASQSAFSSDDVATQTFSEGLCPSDYLFGVNMTFLDTAALVSNNKPVETTVYVDNMWLTFQGRVWGILGTDQYGSDLWSQLVYGSGISLYVGLLAAILSVILGLIVGLAAGYMGRYVDELLMRFSDMLLVIPTLPLLIVLIAVIGPALENLILVTGLLGWMGFARLVRSQVLTLKERPFVEAAKAVGAGKIHIMSKHILPNVVSLVYVSLATSVPGAIVAEAALSFLGFYDPNRMSWGRMLFEAQATGGVNYWWWVIPPGLCIAVLAIAFIMLGFALDEVFNPRLRMRR
jgi:ABC-type dipeptide/oligopeptide/nickel transport system permease subunit